MKDRKIKRMQFLCLMEFLFDIKWNVNCLMAHPFKHMFKQNGVYMYNAMLIIVHLSLASMGLSLPSTSWMLGDKIKFYLLCNLPPPLPVTQFQARRIHTTGLKVSVQIDTILTHTKKKFKVRTKLKKIACCTEKIE